MARAGTPVFTDDTGVRRVTLQLVARAVVAVFVLASVGLALSLMTGVSLPGLDRLVPGPSHEQEHQATREAQMTDRSTTGPHATTGPGGDAGTAGDSVTKVDRASAKGRASARKAMTATRARGSGTTSSGRSGATSAAEPAAEPAPANTPTTTTPTPTPTPQSDKPRGKPSNKPRNPNAATPARGNSAFSNSHVNRATASADPSTTAPGKSGASHGKSGTGGSG